MRSIKLMIVLTATFVPFLAIAQTGVRFESGLSWKQIQDKAKAENKYIFVDCYATWCGPCKWMSTNIFPDKAVGDYMNAHFINVAVQMDKTTKDDQMLRSWYADANSLHDLYKVGAYPTYLFFSPEGTIVHRFSGSRETVNAFLDAVKEAFNPVKQYYSNIKQWATHKTDTAFLFKTYTAARNQHDNTLADSIGEAYLKGQSQTVTIKNINLIIACNLIQSSEDRWFRLFLNNAAKIEAIVNDSTIVGRKLGRIVFKEDILPYYFEGKPLHWKVTKENIMKKYSAIGQSIVFEVEEIIKDHIQREMVSIIHANKNEADWNQLTKILEHKYPDFDLDEQVIIRKVYYYSNKKLWSETCEAVYQLMTKYSDQVSVGRMNSMAWDYVFMHTSSPKVLSAAQKAMSKVLENDFNPIYVDTYANILYKIGERDKALSWEKRAIDTSIKNNGDPRDLTDFRANLAKMQQGQPTWDN